MRPRQRAFSRTPFFYRPWAHPFSRFRDLLDEMRKRADTRFVTITRNPIIIARSVTMAERGVSQIVSVELAEAERFAEAGSATYPFVERKRGDVQAMRLS